MRIQRKKGKREEKTSNEKGIQRKNKGKRKKRKVQIKDQKERRKKNKGYVSFFPE